MVHENRANFGKRAAIRVGVTYVTGDLVIIQDADLELDPAECGRLIAPIPAGQTNVVCRSRFLQANDIPRGTRLKNRLLTGLANLLYGAHLTEALGLALTALLALAALRRATPAFAVLLALAVVARENLIIMLPFLFITLAGSGARSALWRTALAVASATVVTFGALPAVAIALAILPFPGGGDEPSYLARAFSTMDHTRLAPTATLLLGGATVVWLVTRAARLVPGAR